VAYYPIFMDLEGKRALVVGGGTVAERKALTLLEVGALLDLVSRDLSPTLKALLERGRIRWVGRDFKEDHLDGIVIVIAATDDASTNRLVSEFCHARGIPVNVVDQPADCSFIVPAVVRRGDLTLAVSTSGRSPAMARAVRMELEERYGPEYGDFLAIMGSVREKVLSLGRDQKANQALFQALVKSNLLEAVRRQDWTSAAGIITETLGSVWREADIHRSLKQGERRTKQWR
jgi:precorrin-2 dehydrogenase / sirohydrochlorin ferrochelatase